MPTEMLQALLIPFLGTALGAGCVFFIRGNLHWKVERAFTGFAAGVMVAASIWSLIIPAMEQSNAMEKLAFLPALVGFWFGVLFILLLDHIIPHLHRESKESEGMSSSLSRTVKLVLAVTLHNIPEGMAVGVVYAGLLSQMVSGITQTGALALALGIAIQNFPEGAIISCRYGLKGKQRKSIPVWKSVRYRGAHRYLPDNYGSELCGSLPSVLSGICCRNHAVCSSRRTDSGNEPGAALGYRGHCIRHGIFPDDGT